MTEWVGIISGMKTSGKITVFRGKPVSMPVCPQQIRHGFVCVWVWDPAFWGWTIHGRHLLILFSPVPDTAEGGKALRKKLCFIINPMDIFPDVQKNFLCILKKQTNNIETDGCWWQNVNFRNSALACCLITSNSIDLMRKLKELIGTW